MFCSSCGNTLNSGASFCNRCGARQINHDGHMPPVHSPGPGIWRNNRIKLAHGDGKYRFPKANPS